MPGKKKTVKIAAFDRSSCRLLREDIDTALKSVADKHGISLRAGNARFSSDNMTIKLEASTLSKDGQVNSKEKTDFELYGGMFGFKAKDFGASIKLHGTSYEIVGLKPRSRKFPILAKRMDGQRFKLNATDVLMALGRKVSNEAAAEREIDRGLA